MDRTVAVALAAGRRPFADKAFRPCFVFCPRDVHQRSRLLAGEAARLNCLDVLAWFFAREQSELLGASLAYALPRIARRAMTVDALEILLASAVFRDRVSDACKQQVLHECLLRARSSESLSLLVAHGADLTFPVVHASAVKAVSRARLEQLNALVYHGGSLVGAKLVLETEVSRRMSRANALGRFESACTRRVLELGAACGAATGEALIVAAARPDSEMVELLLKEGFADVDAGAEDDGATALVKTGQRCIRPSAYEVKRIVRTLLAYGATVPEDTAAVSRHVETAICAVVAESSDVAGDHSTNSKTTECLHSNESPRTSVVESAEPRTTTSAVDCVAGDAA